ncbi:MAG: hypothetical protein SFV23_09425 [Planctomycetaceae bacterium]|nr:hypothetical protein [Planctomycetaceae bacterium]
MPQSPATADASPPTPAPSAPSRGAGRWLWAAFPILIAGMVMVGFAISQWRPIDDQTTTDEFDLHDEIALGEASPLNITAPAGAAFADAAAVEFLDESPALPPPPGMLDVADESQEVPRWATYETVDAVESHTQPVWLDGTIEEVTDDLDLPMFPARPLPATFGSATSR